MWPVLKWRFFYCKNRTDMDIFHPNCRSLLCLVSHQHSSNIFKTAAELLPPLCYQGSKAVANEIKDTVESQLASLHQSELKRMRGSESISK